MHNLTLPKLQFFHNHISIQTVSYNTSIAEKTAHVEMIRKLIKIGLPETVRACISFVVFHLCNLFFLLFRIPFVTWSYEVNRTGLPANTIKKRQRRDLLLLWFSQTKCKVGIRSSLEWQQHKNTYIFAL